MRSLAGSQAGRTSALSRFATWRAATSRSTDGQHGRAVEPCGAVGLRGHELVGVRYGGDAVRHVGIVGEQASVAVRRVGMVAVHRPDGALAHVAWNDENAFLDKEDQFAEVTVGEQRAKLLQLLVGKDAALGNAPQALRDEPPRALVKKPE